MEKLDVPRNVIENIFVTAIEGGSNHWYFVGEQAHEAIRNAVPFEDEPSFSMALFKAVLDYGVKVDIHDVEDEETLLGTINRNTLYDRLEKLHEDEAFGWALDAELDEQGDAETSDAVFQYIVMEEVPFG